MGAKVVTLIGLAMKRAEEILSKDQLNRSQLFDPNFICKFAEFPVIPVARE